MSSAFSDGLLQSRPAPFTAGGRELDSWRGEFLRVCVGVCVRDRKRNGGACVVSVRQWGRWAAAGKRRSRGQSEE